MTTGAHALTIFNVDFRFTLLKYFKTEWLKTRCKNLLNMLKSRKAISPILATLLLVVIAVSAIIITYAWVMTFITSQTEKSGEFITVTNVDWSNSSQIVVDLINSGTGDTKLLKVYLGMTSTSKSDQTSVSSFSPSSKIISKDGGTMTVTITYSWTSGARHYLRFLTESGNNWDHNEKAP